MLKSIWKKITRKPLSPTQKAKQGTLKLLNLIGKYEADGNYNICFGGHNLDLTHRTLDEILALQAKMKGPSTAVGRYQFIKKTLTGLKKNCGLTGKEQFNSHLQDALAIQLLNQRGLQKYLEGKITPEQFMMNLSKEWASLPKDMGGKSYYDGDGLNKAHCPPQELLACILSLK